jgi:LmbE family N-acetylglucosaminyl deacetylase
MLDLLLNARPSRKLKVLCLGAHSDDIEIGCGGTVLRLTELYPKAEFKWVVFSAREERRKEAEKSAPLFLKGAGGKEVEILDYRDGFFPYNGGQIKDYFESLKTKFTPDIIFTHYRHDLHQDHRLICELTWNTWRHHLILEYEVPKFDGDLGSPNVFVPLEKGVLKRKIDYLLKCFQTQANRHWFCEETFRALPRLRGMESGGAAEYAEAFYGRKLVTLSK